MLVRTGIPQVANTLRLIKRAPFCALGNLRLLLTRRPRSPRSPRSHRHRRHPRHLRESHTLKSHHRRHRIILIKPRERRRHNRKSARWCRRKLTRRLTSISPHPVSSTTSAPATRGLEGPVVGHILLLLLVLETLIIAAFATVVRAVLLVRAHRRGKRRIRRTSRRIEWKRLLCRNTLRELLLLRNDRRGLLFRSKSREEFVDERVCI